MHPYFSPPLPHVFAHRGLALDAPENTLPAFRAALAAGASHLETDVHASADGVAVLSHDPVLPARVGGDRVAGLPVAELRRIDLGGGVPPATLGEALAALPDARFNIDVKEDAALGPVVEAVRRAGAERRVLVASFSERRRRRAARALPAAATGASTPRTLAALAGSALGLRGLVSAAARGLDAAQVPERQRGVPVVTARSVRAFHRAGLLVDVWTVNDPEDMARLLRLGVDGLISDRSDLAAAAVREAGRQSPA